MAAQAPAMDARAAAVQKYRATMISHKSMEGQVKKGFLFLYFFLRLIFFYSLRYHSDVAPTAREDTYALRAKLEKSDNDLKAVQNVGQIIGEVLKQLDDERCMSLSFM
jgi:hypothetical protein